MKQSLKTAMFWKDWNHKHHIEQVTVNHQPYEWLGIGGSHTLRKEYGKVSKGDEENGKRNTQTHTHTERKRERERKCIRLKKVQHQAAIVNQSFPLYKSVLQRVPSSPFMALKKSKKCYKKKEHDRFSFTANNQQQRTKDEPKAQKEDVYSHQEETSVACHGVYALSSFTTVKDYDDCSAYYKREKRPKEKHCNHYPAFTDWARVRTWEFMKVKTQSKTKQTTGKKHDRNRSVLSDTYVQRKRQNNPLW